MPSKTKSVDTWSRRTPRSRQAAASKPGAAAFTALASDSSDSARSTAVREMYKRSRNAYVRISSVASEDAVDCVSEFAPDHSLFNETVFRDTVMLATESDSALRGLPRAAEAGS